MFGDVWNPIIQEERAEVALYIFLNNSNANFDMSEVLSNNNRSVLSIEMTINVNTICVPALNMI